MKSWEKASWIGRGRQQRVSRNFHSTAWPKCVYVFHSGDASFHFHLSPFYRRRITLTAPYYFCIPNVFPSFLLVRTQCSEWHTTSHSEDSTNQWVHSVLFTLCLDHYRNHCAVSSIPTNLRELQRSAELSTKQRPYFSSLFNCRSNVSSKSLSV